MVPGDATTPSSTVRPRSGPAIISAPTPSGCRCGGTPRPILVSGLDLASYYNPTIRIRDPSCSAQHHRDVEPGHDGAVLVHGHRRNLYPGRSKCTCTTRSPTKAISTSRVAAGHLGGQRHSPTPRPTLRASTRWTACCRPRSPTPPAASRLLLLPAGPLLAGPRVVENSTSTTGAPPPARRPRGTALSDLNPDAGSSGSAAPSTAPWTSSTAGPAKKRTPRAYSSSCTRLTPLTATSAGYRHHRRGRPLHLHRGSWLLQGLRPQPQPRCEPGLLR